MADAAAAEVSSRTDYAEQLVAWARVASESRTPRLASSVGLWESPSQLKRRIAVLLNEKLSILRSCSRKWRVICGLGIVTLAVSLSLATPQPISDAEAEVIDTNDEKLLQKGIVPRTQSGNSDERNLREAKTPGFQVREVYLLAPGTKLDVIKSEVNAEVVE